VDADERRPPLVQRGGEAVGSDPCDRGVGGEAHTASAHASTSGGSIGVLGRAAVEGGDGCREAKGDLDTSYGNF
jgi:hypothetical protein